MRNFTELTFIQKTRKKFQNEDFVFFKYDSSFKYISWKETFAGVIHRVYKGKIFLWSIYTSKSIQI